MPIDLKKVNYKNLAHFRFKKLNGKILLTNEAGDHIFLSESEFRNFTEGKLPKKKEPYRTLLEKGFAKEKNKSGMDALAGRFAKKKDFLFSGPSLHIFILTLRCNNACAYCHASAKNMSAKETDMTVETAKKALDMVFSSPNKFIAIEFQGGEPLANWPTLKFIVEEAQKRNRKEKRNLEIRLVSNLNLMTEEKFQYLIKNGIAICSSLDGPEKLHNANRPFLESADRNSHKNVERWISRINEEDGKLKKNGQKHKKNCLTTVSRISLSAHKEIIDEYVRLGLEKISLRALNPFGFSKKIWKKLGYSADEYLDFYKKALGYIIEVNLKGIKLKEWIAAVFLQKILTEKDPNMLENRCPCGAGIGQLAYNHNGDIYTCDEGRMLSEMGDESFRLGNVNGKYKDLMDNAVTKSLCAASCLIGTSGCNDCAYLPYCGTCPIYNYAEQGNIFGQMPANDRCKISKGILDFLFEKMEDEKTRGVFESWMSKA